MKSVLFFAEANWRQSEAGQKLYKTLSNTLSTICSALQYTLKPCQTLTELKDLLQNLQKDEAELLSLPLVLCVCPQDERLSALLNECETHGITSITLVPEAQQSQVFRQLQAAQVPLYTQYLPENPTSFQLLAAFRQAERYAELLRLLQTGQEQDDRTGFYNSRSFLKRLEAEMSLARRHLSPLSVVIVGLEYYTVLLDTYGDHITSLMLRQVGERILPLIRKEDILARLSDSELVLLLPRSSEKGARVMMERMLKSLDQQPFVHEDIRETLEVAVGIAGYPVPDMPDESLLDGNTMIRYARHALHHARCSGNDPALFLFSQIVPVL